MATHASTTRPPNPAAHAHRPATQQPSACTLVFPLDQVLTAAEHAVTAPRHADCDEETEYAPHLCWTTSNGISLTSNGRLPNTAPITPAPAVYAHGHGPGTTPHPALTASRDGLFHAIDLLTPDDDGDTQLDVLRTAALLGFTRFVLRLTDDGSGPLLTTTTN